MRLGDGRGRSPPRLDEEGNAKGDGSGDLNSICRHDRYGVTWLGWRWDALEVCLELGAMVEIVRLWRSKEGTGRCAAIRYQSARVITAHRSKNDDGRRQEWRQDDRMRGQASIACAAIAWIYRHSSSRDVGHRLLWVLGSASFRRVAISILAS